MKKTVLLFFVLCCFATVSWGQKDTIHPGEGPYDWPDFDPTDWNATFPNGCNPSPIMETESKYLARYTPDNPEQAVYGIGVVASPDSRNATWGVKLYSSLYGSVPSTPAGYRDEDLRCELQVPYTSATPYSYFNITGTDIYGTVADTTVYIYNFYFENPYYVINYDTIYLGFYDSLIPYYLPTDCHPIVYYMVQHNREQGCWSATLYDNEARIRICDSVPFRLSIYTQAWTGEILGIFPITSPPPPRDTVPVCDAGAENLRLVRQGEQYGRQTAVVAWDAVGSSTYAQVRWGRYTVDSLTSEVTLQDGYVATVYNADTLLIRGLDTGWFACRVRAVCEHECFYHDETDYSDWSDTLYFYMAPPPLPPDTTAIAQTAQPLQVRIAPNPVQGTLTVSTEQEDSYTIEVYNDMGVRLQTERFTGTRHRLDVSRLPKGHYLLAVATKQAITRLAFVKQ